MRQELLLFLRYAGYGAILHLAYDVIRLGRRIRMAGRVRIAAEDVLYWLAVAFFLFWRLFSDNEGIFRGDLLLGLLSGVVAYHLSVTQIVLFGRKRLKTHGKRGKLHSRKISK